MADFEYVDVNGRQIRVRPRETAQEIDEYGSQTASRKVLEKGKIR